MIILKLQGGLGNQLFQYALARQISIKRGKKLLFDTTYYRFVRNRKFLLDQFNTKGKNLEFSDAPSLFLTTLPVIGKIYLKILKIFGVSKFSRLTESQFYTFDPKWYSGMDNLYLEGFWNNPEYLTLFWPRIKRELSQKESAFAHLSMYLKTIKSTESVAVHVRRTDYLKVKNLGVCSIRYYKDAVRRMRTKLHNPQFYVFSDDLNWSKKNLHFLADATFVDFTINEIEDFFLMRNCKHHVIANSTFSWWAARLKEHKKHLIIAPYPWQSATSPADSLVLSSWIKIRKN
jgi:hypothetical protein